MSDLMAEVDALRSDGGQVHIRPVRPEDADALRALTRRTSDRSIYLRFFSQNRLAAEHYATTLVGAINFDRRALVATVAGDVVAVAGYERLTSISAEVALLAEDVHQGEGIGTLLLEHLASLARHEGIRCFVAEVLLENAAMIEVFHHLGYRVDESFEGSQMHVVCHLVPDESTQSVIDGRDRIADRNSLRPVLAPRSVAVIGASGRSRSVGHELLHSVVSGGFAGPIYPVNPHHGRLAGLKSYRSAAELPDGVELAVVAVPPRAVPDVVRECGERGVRGIVLVTSGFRETGSSGLEREAAVVELAHRYGMRLIGPNCLGIINTDPQVRLDATFSSLPMRRGGLGLASQSGALGIAVALDAARSGLGLSQFVSLGNKADVSSNDLMQWWADDPDTTVVGLYLESFGNPQKFARIGREVSRTKPILVIKSGRTDAGQRAGRSHTAAAASPDRVVDALCAQAGALRVDTVEQFIDTARVLDSQPLPTGPRLVIIGNSGGPEILAADAAAAAGLTVAALSPAAVDSLRAAVPAAASVANPIDLGGDTTPAALAAAMDAVLETGEADSLLVVIAPTVSIGGAEAQEVVWSHAASIPIAVTVLGSTGVAAEDGSTRPVPFAFPEPAAAALGSAWRYAGIRSAPLGRHHRPDGIDLTRAAQILAGADPQGWLEAQDVADLLAAYRITASPQRVVRDVNGALLAARQLGYPVVAKATGLVHKTDVGGVRVDLRTPAEVRTAYAELALLGDAVLIQPMAVRGTELIVGCVADPRFGPLVMLGVGGVLADLISGRAFRLAPLTDVDAEEMIAALPSSLLNGFRGGPAISRTALAGLLQRVSQLVDDHPEIAELDFNPVIAAADTMLVVDAKVRLGKPNHLTDPLTRQLSAPEPRR